MAAVRSRPRGGDGLMCKFNSDGKCQFAEGCPAGFEGRCFCPGPEGILIITPQTCLPCQATAHCRRRP
jgi:hypothetical protein